MEQREQGKRASGRIHPHQGWVLVVGALILFPFCKGTWTRISSVARFSSQSTLVYGQVVRFVKETCTQTTSGKSGKKSTRTYDCYTPEIEYTYHGKTYSTPFPEERSGTQPIIGEQVSLYVTSEPAHQARFANGGNYQEAIWWTLGTLFLVGFWIAAFFIARSTSRKNKPAASP